MNSMLKYLVFCLSLCVFLWGDAHFLKEKIAKSQSGDYLVFEINKTITLLSVHSITNQSITFEEISIPSQTLKKHPTSWAQWVKNKAPGHTSWSMTEIDLKSGQIIECYSFSRSSWIQLSSKESLFATLLQLPLKPLGLERRPRIGPPPVDGELDTRKIWEPAIYFEGKKKTNPFLSAYETVWPQDDTELSNKTIIVYFDKENNFPFPFWIQVETSYATPSLRAIDSGKKLSSPFSSLPKKTPQFVGHPQKTKTGLRFSVKSPKYYREFELFAVDITNKEKQIYPISHSLVEGTNEFLTIEIDEAHLQQTLEPNHRYTWLLVPIGHIQSYTETNKPFVWSE